MAAPVSVTRLTASGRGAVAVVRVQPDTDAEILDGHFRSATNRKASEAEIGRILYGHWGAEDVVVVRTAVDEWEVNCHGGDAAVGKIISDLGGSGAPPSQSRLNSRLLSALLQCRTRRTANFVLSQQQGALRNFLQQLVDTTSVDDAISAVESVLKWESFASHLCSPWKIAVVGRPNAGKSSLLNTVLGYERSIVFDQPGTTRDRVEAEVVIDGWPFVLVDTAGVRDDATDEIEAIGVAASRQSITDSDACLLVTDSVAGWTTDDDLLLAEVSRAPHFCVLWNKVDISSGDLPQQLSSVPVIFTSAITETGLPELLNWLSTTMVSEIPAVEQPLPIIGEIAEIFRDFFGSKNLPELKRAINEWLEVRKQHGHRPTN